MAWELSTEVLGIPAERIYVSVFEEDDEAFALWRDQVGVPPERIKRMGAKDNFWASGPTGPCGPCSELYYDFHPERGVEGADLEDDSRFIEFYNLVFMEFNRDAAGELTPLARKNIDTGMGLERVAQILQGVPNNYETDLLMPILDRAAGLAGLAYPQADARQALALKVIADHTRAVSYLISDGVTPSNVGRGYVVRRLIRRVVMKGRSLGIPHPFLPEVARVAVSLSGGCDPEVQANEGRVLAELQREEEAFVATLKKGEKILAEVLDSAEASGRGVSGADAFLLYDTFGFPLECTVESAQERGVAVDEDGFAEEMERQKRMSKDAREEVDLTAGAELGAVRAEAGATEFRGYADLDLEGASVVALLVGGARSEAAAEGDEVEVVLDRTPFYAESGGQAGDRGTLEAASGAVLRVADVQKAAGGDLFVHKATVVSGQVRVGEAVRAAVEPGARARVKSNHTATHLLQAALKAVLGDEVGQQGSLVTEERLRFDFNYPKALTPAQVAEVEALVNQWVGQAHALETAELPIAEAKARGATAMFGERYGDVVRVVDVPGVSMELCGGTHVANTSEIRGFKVLSEAGIASGIRRIEAVTGEGMVAHMDQMDAIVRELSGSLKVKPEEVAPRVRALQDELKATAKELAEAKSALALAKSQALVSEAVEAGAARVLVARMDGVEAKALGDAAASMQQKLGDGGAVVLGAANGDKVALVAAFGKDVVGAGQNAGKLVGAVARTCGGGGGGKPNMAQAGGKDASRLDDALAQARADLLAALQ